MARPISDHGSKASAKIGTFRIKEALVTQDYPGCGFAVLADRLNTGRKQAESQEEQHAILLDGILNTNISQLGTQPLCRWGQDLVSAHEDADDQRDDAGQREGGQAACACAIQPYR